VRLCASDRPTWLRVEAARQLAHLTEFSHDLQSTAAITDHLVTTLKEFLSHVPQEDESLPKPEYLSPSSCGQFDEPELYSDLMCEAALLVYASLAANNEAVRQKIVKGHGLIECINEKLESGSPALKLAAARCLHSLTRSVYTLRTTFQDNPVWKFLVAILQDLTADDELKVSALCAITNLALEFSLCKEHLMNSGIIGILANFTRSDNYDLKFNALWGLMNVSFQADLSVKEKILQHLSVDAMFNLVSTNDKELICKTLGLLRNLLSPKQDIDTIMRTNSNAVLQIVIWLLEGDLTPDVKEQALCVLANIANGEQSKEVLIGNDDILKKLFNYMRLQTPALQMAATMCVGNLADTADPNPLDRQLRLREARIEKALEGLLSTNHASLFDKVKYALDMFKFIGAASSTVTMATMATITTSTASVGSSASNGSSSASSTPGPNWRSADQGP
ncbi:armadillo repeat-containing protein 8, partial [Hyalella azteca]|uniref:Armadillo repeat-containing protein 8 n=1 Tax=Hyalella azteca TaxID=294128 RepID=A0A8B7PJB7_HYAAZ